MYDPVTALDVSFHDLGVIHHHLAVARHDLDILTVQCLGAVHLSGFGGQNIPGDDVISQNSGELILVPLQKVFCTCLQVTWERRVSRGEHCKRASAFQGLCQPRSLHSSHERLKLPAAIAVSTTSLSPADTIPAQLNISMKAEVNMDR